MKTGHCRDDMPSHVMSCKTALWVVCTFSDGGFIIVHKYIRESLIMQQKIEYVFLINDVIQEPYWLLP